MCQHTQRNCAVGGPAQNDVVQMCGNIRAKKRRGHSGPSWIVSLRSIPLACVLFIASSFAATFYLDRFHNPISDQELYDLVILP